MRKNIYFSSIIISLKFLNILTDHRVYNSEIKCDETFNKIMDINIRVTGDLNIVFYF